MWPWKQTGQFKNCLDALFDMGTNLGWFWSMKVWKSFFIEITQNENHYEELKTSLLFSFLFTFHLHHHLFLYSFINVYVQKCK